MAGNSQRKGAVRKTGTKKGAVVGSGGQSRRAIKPKGPTPPGVERKGHPAARRAAAAARRDAPAGTAAARPRRETRELPETVVGRNPVVEALRAGIPATALYLAQGVNTDERLAEAVALAGNKGIALMEVARPELDRLTGNAIHQGLALQVPPYTYAHPDDLLARAKDSGRAPLLVAVDGVTDPRNLGAIIRSAAAFGAHGVIVPERRSAGVTASAWRTSAGTAARLRVARCTNLVRTLKDLAAAGLMIAGLDADGDMDTDTFELATSPLVIVVGSEGRGLARLTRTVCDVTVSIPMARTVESLNASVATGVVLAEVARRRRVEAGRG
ncbi:23S rRNA (guanosine(2251)-2'-O)-methyltransferase RlmB [Nakamurella flavida]|uniref:23S rRNA (Guanosine(2251)-2'-O)-methyltransferase RlmB n=1 Tax=Nakamurella flavida TaxID=363630 RepID=A0A938YHV1_9ACTN|nr:23S rRNA (guanosine(2251)-2'-O)-methyltransferase RlmB [Nakamurella flavida]MBM9477966.1 23S rRNA (guanosine(2251)-2'-O)-methyltransferase RlmB [Nakamurella flavida]MDP9778318.1 23S rRNA (guanosine2251-2'-O)-methyltransferase [Nakamurella flavida]